MGGGVSMKIGVRPRLHELKRYQNKTKRKQTKTQGNGNETTRCLYSDKPPETDT